MNKKNDPAAIIKQAKDLLAEIDATALKEQLSALQAETLQPDFWDHTSAQETMQEIGRLNNRLAQIQEIEQLKQDLSTSLTLLAETDQSGKKDSVQQLQQEAKQLAAQLDDRVQQLKIEKFLSGRFDRNHAIISIHPGQGGTEAMDWASMLARMYQRYFERKDWRFEFITEIKGEEAGIKEAVFEVKAPFAYGYLKKEKGTHRLIRLSPFNADNLRQTSFALVEVMPVVDKEIEVDLKDEDLEWNFTRAGGPGGQSVNKTNSAVELTHKPSQITVKSRQARSQVANKKQALKILKAKLAALQEQKMEQKLTQEKGSYQPASWGTQIRNYVLHPYQLVKDTRTEVETNDAQAVLDGELEPFITALITED